jgi:tRNA dimethylallyltransferase
MKQRIFVIAGPTAVGKSELAERLAVAFDGEIISADSVQVYRGYDVGSAKPSAEERTRVPHHLIDIRDWNQMYSAADFMNDADAAIAAASARGRVPIVVGGTGLYIRSLIHGLSDSPSVPDEVRQNLRAEREALGDETMWQRLKGIDEAAAARIHANDHVRVLRALEVWEHTGRTMSDWQNEHGLKEERYDVRGVVLDCERPRLWSRIAGRTDRMMNGGLIEEVQRHLTAGHTLDCSPMASIGYSQVSEWLMGGCAAPLDEVVKSISVATRRYAKRQLTWFRGQSQFRWVATDDGLPTDIRGLMTRG